MKTRGMTLIEVLVAIAIFAVVIAISSSVTVSLSTNRISADRLRANQAAQAFFETVTEYWRSSSTFGRTDAAFPLPTDLTGYTWSLKISEVDMASPTFAAKSSVSWTKTSTPAYSASASATLMNLALTYTSQGSGTSFVNGTEIYKR
ncbi:prepilin-type N-terminal cleavage/methylation domain-containing protein [Deinococcus deserti]|uniref:Putative prepilin-like protein n=1 Tax=Deinococcus deserti (strain DSM 17065 / CIP 109153 / LMG 22923 / VCD115) TaxID=546414 RepID=C1CZ48_DEIDV|nr:prepilin-type N-terminal cleavage/methylation domain-containing protein [Deinococcus deserti]ACO45086.1 putative prepilin-like protein, precursor [Deinococcus deserti VCD115]